MFCFLLMCLFSSLHFTNYRDLFNNNNNNNNNNYYYYYLLQLDFYPVAVVILHVYKT